jgi:hypothetical protein
MSAIIEIAMLTCVRMDPPPSRGELEALRHEDDATNDLIDLEQAMEQFAKRRR